MFKEFFKRLFAHSEAGDSFIDHSHTDLEHDPQYDTANGFDPDTKRFLDESNVAEQRDKVFRESGGQDISAI